MAGYSYNRYADNIARKKRRHFFLKFLLGLSLLILGMVAIIYGAFFSTLLQITEVKIEGLKNLKYEEIYPIIDTSLNQKIFELIPIKPQRNILFFSDDLIKNSILDQFPIVKEFTVKKNYPHEIIAYITERTTMGTWCFGQECNYFDSEGILWGKALKSSGSLLLLVDDLRIHSDRPKKIDHLYLEGIKKALAGLSNLKIQPIKVEIPADSIDDIRIYTVNNFYVLFSMGSDIDKQLRVLKIFLENQDGNFRPDYIDVGIEGRAYYK